MNLHPTTLWIDDLALLIISTDLFSHCILMQNQMNRSQCKIVAPNEYALAPHVVQMTNFIDVHGQAFPICPFKKKKHFLFVYGCSCWPAAVQMMVAKAQSHSSIRLLGSQFDDRGLPVNHFANSSEIRQRRAESFQKINTSDQHHLRVNFSRAQATRLAELKLA